MTSCPHSLELFSTSHNTTATISPAQVLHVIAQIERADDEGEVIALIHDATRRLGADVAMFTSVIRVDTTLATYRNLLACDPLWGTAYAANDWYEDDLWLQHAMRSTDPVRASELMPNTARQTAMVQAAEQAGFQSALIVPAPTAAGPSRVGMLCIGSKQRSYFEGEDFLSIKLLARTLAMEVHDWQLRQLRTELRLRTQLTEQELQLLRLDADGHTSKAIATALHTDARTIDCRFQRLNYKLGTAHRRDSVRQVKLYGLI